jgi:uncharacterized protein YndB with AHSA1/START domain
MPVTRRSRSLAADPADVWRLVADPHHLPRWWPLVTRVESVEGGAFTTVMSTERGKLVRADQLVVESREPTLLRWRQQLVDTPFERILRAASTGVTVEPAAEGPRVTLELEQRMRGLARFGGFMVRRAARNQLDSALDGLERIVG